MLHIKHSKSQYETKPWMNPGLPSSVRNKNKLYKSFCKENDSKTKECYEKQFKSYRYQISSLLRKVKDSYCKQYFKNNNKKS